MDLQYLADVSNNRGEVFTFTGPMRSEKTSKAISLAKKLNGYSPYRVLLVTNDVNTRDLDKNGNPLLKSANGEISKLPPVMINHDKPEQLIELIQEENKKPSNYNPKKTGNVDVLFIEECNFFNSKFPEIIEQIRLDYPDLMMVLLGLNYDFKKRPFGIMGWANSNFTKYEGTSFCNIVPGKHHPCGKLTKYTARLVNPDKIEGYDEETINVADKFDNTIERLFTPDPIFAPTVIPEEQDNGTGNESHKTRLYTVACRKHHKLPYQKEALKIEIFIKNSLRNNEAVALEKVLELFEKIKYRDQIIRYITEERGVRFDNDAFILRKYVPGKAHGNYLPHPDEDLTTGIYMPEIRNLLLSESEKKLLN